MNRILFTILSLVLCTGCFAGEPSGTLTPKPSPSATAFTDDVKTLKVNVITNRPHDPSSFTQGLLWHDGSLFESAGLYGESSLRRVNAVTGDVEAQTPVEKRYFAEGLALVDDRLIQLTWREGKALVYDANSLQQVAEFDYKGEGWGLCYDGKNRLYMSDGSAILTKRDPKTFAVLGTTTVTLHDKPVANVNELEWAEGKIYANIWQKQLIVEIDPATGRVTAMIHAEGLLKPAEQKGADVLNGIAYDPIAKHFIITGKHWPRVFEVTFEEDKN